MKTSLLSLSLLTIVAVANAAEKNEVAIEVAQAGPDFALQGEYDGGDAKIGVQVIALGDGKFRACIEPGGLPGAGSDGKTNKIEIEAAAQDGKLTFSDKGWQLDIAGGNATGKDAQGKAFTAKQVVRESPTMGAKPPAGALVLFDGSNADQWNGSMDDRKLLKFGATSKQRFKDFTLHIEFRLPFKPFARGQERGNSGVYLQNRYEIQVLDTFGLKGVDNECGGIYKIAEPKINACFPPLSWQTYDVDFAAAKYDDAGKKTANAVATIKHNGFVIHDHLELPHATAGHGLEESAEPGPFYLQDHGNPVFYRNIWLVVAK